MNTIPKLWSGVEWSGVEWSGVERRVSFNVCYKSAMPSPHLRFLLKPSAGSPKGIRAMRRQTTERGVMVA